ncbi:MAG: XdhC family protein, partial [bacterium]|nr:XdhC family protein [bacterium]
MAELIERIAELKAQGIQFCIVTVVDTKGATPRKAGARAVVFENGRAEGTVGGGAIEVVAFQKAVEILKTGAPSLIHYKLDQLEQAAMICGGEMTIFYEPVYPEKIVTIFGGGHVGRAVAQVASVAGWKVRVIDEREGALDPAAFPKNSSLVAQPYIEFIDKQAFDRYDWLVIVTPKHKHDESILERVVDCSARYIGMMGSP